MTATYRCPTSPILVLDKQQKPDNRDDDDDGGVGIKYASHARDIHFR